MPASRVATSASVSGSPSSMTPIWKSSSPSSPTADGARLPTVAVTCGRAGRLARQDAGMRTTTPALSKLGDAVEKARRLRGSPAQRMEDIPGIDHRLQPGAMFRGALHRQEQGQQLVPVRRSGVFAQRLAEGDVLRLRLGGKAGGVGRHEGEGLVGIAAVFRQVEMHPADQVPGRIQGGQEGLQSGPCGGKGRGEGSRHLIPQRQQDILGQIFGPRHHRRGQHQG